MMTKVDDHSHAFITYEPKVLQMFPLDVHCTLLCCSNHRMNRIGRVTFRSKLEYLKPFKTANNLRFKCPVVKLWSLEISCSFIFVYLLTVITISHQNKNLKNINLFDHLLCKTAPTHTLHSPCLYSDRYLLPRTVHLLVSLQHVTKALDDSLHQAVQLLNSLVYGLLAHCCVSGQRFVLGSDGRHTQSFYISKSSKIIHPFSVNLSKAYPHQGR